MCQNKIEHRCQTVHSSLQANVNKEDSGEQIVVTIKLGKPFTSMVFVVI